MFGRPKTLNNRKPIFVVYATGDKGALEQFEAELVEKIGADYHVVILPTNSKCEIIQPPGD